MGRGLIAKAPRGGEAKMLTLALGLLALTSAAQAQDAGAGQTVAAVDGPPPQAQSPSCELHVWPAPDLHLAYYGWTKGGTRRPAANGPFGSLPGNLVLFTSGRQAEKLRNMALAEIVGLPGYSVVVHDGPADTVALRRVPEQRLVKGAACYAELALQGVSFQYDVITGKSLNVIFRMRQFRGETLEKPATGSFVTEKLNVTLEGGDAMSPEAFMAEIERGFDADMRRLGEALLQIARTGSKKKR